MINRLAIPKPHQQKDQQDSEDDLSHDLNSFKLKELDLGARQLVELRNYTGGGFAV